MPAADAHGVDSRGGAGTQDWNGRLTTVLVVMPFPLQRGSFRSANPRQHPGGLSIRTSTAADVRDGRVGGLQLKASRGRVQQIGQSGGGLLDFRSGAQHRDPAHHGLGAVGNRSYARRGRGHRNKIWLRRTALACRMALRSRCLGLARRVRKTVGPPRPTAWRGGSAHATQATRRSASLCRPRPATARKG